MFYKVHAGEKIISPSVSYLSMIIFDAIEVIKSRFKVYHLNY